MNNIRDCQLQVTSDAPLWRGTVRNNWSYLHQTERGAAWYYIEWSSLGQHTWTTWGDLVPRSRDKKQHVSPSSHIRHTLNRAISRPLHHPKCCSDLNTNIISTACCRHGIKYVHPMYLQTVIVKILWCCIPRFSIRELTISLCQGSDLAWSWLSLYISIFRMGPLA